MVRPEDLSGFTKYSVVGDIQEERLKEQFYRCVQGALHTMSSSVVTMIAYMTGHDTDGCVFVLASCLSGHKLAAPLCADT